MFATVIKERMVNVRLKEKTPRLTPETRAALGDLFRTAYDRLKNDLTDDEDAA